MAPIKNMSFESIGTLARNISIGFPTPIPSLSEIEVAALFGALKTIWAMNNKKDKSIGNNNEHPPVDTLYDRMIANGSEVARNLQSKDGPTVPMSVRVSPQVKAYYDAQAKACGAASASAMVAMVLHGVMMSTEQAND